MYYKKQLIEIKELNRKAKLYIGLPDDYETSDERYPVLYMHDGHNVFDKADSYIGEIWDIIGAYKKDPTLPKIIVVGLECAAGWNRFDEYCPYPFDLTHFHIHNERLIGGRGDQYLNYIVNTLKPMIDKDYRTLSDKDNTGIMGSSMGGYISCYAAAKYNHVFTRIGALSGAYYVCLEKLLQTIKQSDLQSINKFYMDTGTNEVGLGRQEDYIHSNNQVYLALKEKLSLDKLRFELIEGAIHNETQWAKRLPGVLKYIFS